MLSESKIIQRNADMVHASMGDNTVIMSVINGEYYGINDVGSLIWEYLESNLTVGQLIDKLVNHFGITREQCITDTEKFLALLIEKDMIQIRETA